MLRKTRFVLLPLALLVAPRVHAQGTVRTLAKPDAEYGEPFTNIVSVRELRDRRVLVADSRERTVQLVDLAGKRATRVGREGSGPGEFGQPSSLSPLPGDSTLLFDPANQRYLIIKPDGTPGETLVIEITSSTPSGPDGRGARLVIGGPRGSDTRGRLYFEGSPVTFGPDGPKAADSAALYRYDRATKKADTVGFMRLPPNSPQVTELVMSGLADPFLPLNTWAVARDGRVAIAHPADYHVDWLTDGQRVRGASITYDRIKVTEADKQEWRDARAKARPMQRTQTTTAAGAPRPATVTDPPTWSEYKPAFLRGQGTVVASPTGEAWVLRARGAGNEVPAYDVFDGQGRVIGKVVLPKRTRLVGFGTSSVYLVRLDQDDLQYLQRYPLR